MVGAPDASLLQLAQAFLPVAIALCLGTSVYADSHERPDTAYPGPVVPEYEKEPQPSSGFERIFSDTADAEPLEQEAESLTDSDSIVSDTADAEPSEQEAESSTESDSVVSDTADAEPPEQEAEPSTESVSDIAYPGPVVPEYEKEPQPSSGFERIFSDTTDAEPLEQEAEPSTDSDSVVSDTADAEPLEEEAEPSTESDSVSDIAYPGPVAPEYEKEPQPLPESDSVVSDTADAEPLEQEAEPLPESDSVVSDTADAEPLEQEAEPQPLPESDSVVSDTANEGSPGQEETPQLSIGLDSIFTDEGQTADVASLENAVTRFRSVRMGIELSLAECEELSLCSPPVNGEELDTLIQLLDEHVDMLSRLREDAESPGEFDELLSVYSNERGSMEGLAGDLEGLGKLPVAVPDFELPDTDAIEAELTETLLEFEDTDEELLDDESDESFEDFGDEIPAE